MAEIGQKVQLIGDLGAQPITKKTELLTDPQDVMTWLAFARSVAMFAGNGGVHSATANATVVGVIDQLINKFKDMTTGQETLNVMN